MSINTKRRFFGEGLYAYADFGLIDLSQCSLTENDFLELKFW